MTRSTLFLVVSLRAIHCISGIKHDIVRARSMISQSFSLEPESASMQLINNSLESARSKFPMESAQSKFPSLAASIWENSAIKQQLISCSEKKWTNIDSAWMRKTEQQKGETEAKYKERMALHLYKEIKERIDNQGQPMSQGSEGACGPMSLGNIFAVLSPGGADRYGQIIADLFCDGEAKFGNGKVRKVHKDYLTCEVSTGSSSNLINLNNSSTGMPAVDWIWASFLYSQKWAWYSQFSSACGSIIAQSTLPTTIRDMAKIIFPPEKASKVQIHGRHFQILALTASCASLHFSGPRKKESEKTTWDKILDGIRAGGQAVVFISPKGGKGFGAYPWHYVTLTDVFDKNSFPEDPCATEILGKKRWCVVWSERKYYVFECDHLRKLSCSAITIPAGARRMGVEEKMGVQTNVRRFQNNPNLRSSLIEGIAKFSISGGLAYSRAYTDYFEWWSDSDNLFNIRGLFEVKDTLQTYQTFMVPTKRIGKAQSKEGVAEPFKDCLKTYGKMYSDGK